MKIETPSRVSTSEFVADTLRREILAGDILPGQPLPQDRLASRFDVSQSSVREALRRLEALSLVVSIRNRGAFVSGLTPDQVEELYEIRLALELIALRHNFGHLAQLQLDEAESLLDTIDRGDEIAFFGSLHRRFHAIFYEGGERKFTKDILDSVYGNLTRVWADVVKKRPRFAHECELKSRREHRLLLDATVRGDRPAAEEVLERHISDARDALIGHVREFGIGIAGVASLESAPASKPAMTPARARA
jgi:DNA-binding GntR family transcriptional regulator